jgi:hypothetical protein
MGEDPGHRILGRPKGDHEPAVVERHRRHDAGRAERLGRRRSSSQRAAARSPRATPASRRCGRNPCSGRRHPWDGTAGAAQSEWGAGPCRAHERAVGPHGRGGSASGRPASPNGHAFLCGRRRLGGQTGAPAPPQPRQAGDEHDAWGHAANLTAGGGSTPAQGCGSRWRAGTLGSVGPLRGADSLVHPPREPGQSCAWNRPPPTAGPTSSGSSAAGGVAAAGACISDCSTGVRAGQGRGEPQGAPAAGDVGAATGRAGLRGRRAGRVVRGGAAGGVPPARPVAGDAATRRPAGLVGRLPLRGEATPTPRGLGGAAPRGRPLRGVRGPICWRAIRSSLGRARCPTCSPGPGRPPPVAPPASPRWPVRSPAGRSCAGS